MSDAIRIIFSTDFGFSVLRLTTPILFAAMAALITDRAGVINIGLEGTMLFSALAGVLASAATKNVWIGLFAAVSVGIFVSLVLAFFSLNLKTNIILAGIAINLMGSGGTMFILYALTGKRGTSEGVASLTLPNVQIPILKDIPVLGPIFSGHNIMTYLALLSVAAIWFFLYKTRLGLRIRAVGENSHAAASVGIPVRRIQYIAIAVAGALTGFGGAFMSMGYVSMFTKDMTAGRGFIALAAEAMGGGQPVATMISCFVFGLASALSNNLQALRIPPEFVLMLPYLATILGLMFYSARKRKKAS